MLAIGNDPTLTRMEIGEQEENNCVYLPPDNDWQGLGYSIGRNTHLDEISLIKPYGSDAISTECLLRHFLPGFVLNRSIRKFSIGGLDLSDGRLLNAIVPFFRNNPGFECLNVYDHATTDGTNLQLIASTLLSFDTLKEFTILGDTFDNNAGDHIIDALANHPRLEKISINDIQISRSGFARLATILHNQRFILSALELGNVQMDHQGAIALATGLASSTMLKDIEISCSSDHWPDHTVTEIGLRAIFTALYCSRCRLEKLSLTYHTVNDAAFLWLASALFRHSTTLMMLKLSNCQGFSLASLNVLFQILRDPNSALEILHLDNNTSFTDEGIAILANALVHNDRLRVLDISSNANVTEAGWTAFSTVLSRPNSALESLYMTTKYDGINNNVVVAFAEALALNNRLKELTFSCSILSDGRATLSRLLCNTSSIMSTFHSNHTLERLFPIHSITPRDLRTILQINKENNRIQAARLKIIKTHFCERDINMQPFAHMSMRVRPYAIAWMAKDNHSYQFMRAMPSLLEVFKDR